MTSLKKLASTLEMIKFSHSIFALPFALGAMIVAARGWPGWKIFLLIVAAMVSARSAAMAFNRLVDLPFDRLNPRTEARHLPQGTLSKGFVTLFTVACAFLFFLVCFYINPLSFRLSPVALLILLGYSFAKRFTHFTHLWLGVALGIAPLAAWIAVTGEWPWPALPLGAAVALWVAGFDILYATQDVEFDRKMGLGSLVSKLGLDKALLLSRFLHLASILFFFQFGYINQLHLIYYFTVVLIGGGLLYEQSLVKTNDLSKVNAAFFTANGIISLLFLIGIILHFHLH
ncbi:MAG: 4-hydroxybenzoate octaprenyltransferase [Deltaproteobacteria bacterium]|nr:4-hydroxybenzoate octaprenyltransferase [Deltaproteobacteria bacterium]MDZ4225160.1 4-hydroxybenzoate octaprenyltransferase [bacterium]